MAHNQMQERVVKLKEFWTQDQKIWGSIPCVDHV